MRNHQKAVNYYLSMLVHKAGIDQRKSTTLPLSVNALQRRRAWMLFFLRPLAKT